MRKYVVGLVAFVGILIAIGCGVDAGLGLTTGPVATFTATPQTATYMAAPVDITLNASGSYVRGGGIILEYRWDYDYDGSTPNYTLDSAVHVHTYNQPGRYRVRLEVLDDQARTDTYELYVSIYPAAAISATPTAVCVGNDSAADDTVNFDAGGSDAGPGDSITQYDWDFGDGTTITAGSDTESHTYTAPSATRTASVTITTALGGTASKSVDIKVVDMTAQFTSPASGAPGANVDVDASTSVYNSPAGGDAITTYTWDWGDSSPTSSGVTASHQYSTAGDYTITLTVLDSNGFTDQETAPITIADLAAVIYACDATSPPPADVTSVSGNQPLTVTFDDTHCVGVGITEYAWDWEWVDTGTPGPDAGDFTADDTYGTPATNRSHVYNTSTTAVLRIYDGSNYSYDTVTISVTLPPLQAEIEVTAGATVDANATFYGSFDRTPGIPYVYYVEADLSGGVASVDFDASKSTGSILAWGWDTSGGLSLGSGEQITYDFDTEGVYVVRLSVTDGADTDWATSIVTVADTSQGHSYLSHRLLAGGGTGDQDTSVLEGDPDDPTYGENHIHVESGPTTEYVLFQSDVSLWPELTAGDVIVEGGLVLFCYRENGAGDDVLHVYEALGAWDETTCTWNNHPGFDNTTDYLTLGGLGTATGLAFDLSNVNEEYPPHPYYYPITTLLNQWFTTPAGNNGAYITAEPSVDLSYHSCGWQGSNTRNPIFLGIKQ